MARFNVLEHQMVPEHYLLSLEEEKEVLKQLNITRDQLPKLRMSDPAVRILRRIETDVKEGRIVRIIRESQTAGQTTVYRLLIRG